MSQEVETIREFVSGWSTSDSVWEMEKQIEKAIGYCQRVGELSNNAEVTYYSALNAAIEKIQDMVDETETSRQAKLKAFTAEQKREWENLKLLFSNLRNIIRALMQAIKTRREEPR